MGIYDRDYYRAEDSAPGVYRSGGRSMVTTLIIINVAIFLLDVFTPVTGRDLAGRPTAHWLGDLMALRSDLLTHPWDAWKLLTCGFAHAPFDSQMFLWHVGFNMYGLWLFGRDVENVYGPREFLRIYLVLIVLSGLAWVVVQTVFQAPPAGLVGASGAVVGIIILFALHFPHRKFFLLFLPGFPIPAWVLGLVIVGFDVLGAFGAGRGNVAYVAHLAGAGFALIYFRSRINFGRLLPRRPLEILKSRPKLRIHDPQGKQRKLDQRADLILDKLHREGESALTAKERRVLEDYSRRMREKQNES